MKHHTTPDQTKMTRDKFDIYNCKLSSPQRQESSLQLKKLYAKGVRDQWNPDTAIDWSIEVPFGSDLPQDPGLPLFLESSIGSRGPSFWNKFRWEYQIWLVSQFLHGEHAALAGAAYMTQMIKEIDAKKVAAVQVMDEARHIEVFNRYLTNHSPVEPYPITPPFSDLINESLSHSNWDFALLGIQVLIEGVAIAAFRMAEITLHDDLIRSIVRLVHRDEARHTSFGLISLKNFYCELSEYERRERTDFLSTAAEVIVQRFLLEDVWERLEVNKRDGVRFAASNELMLTYRRMIFAKVISIIRHVGLMSPKLKHNLTQLGFAPLS